MNKKISQVENRKSLFGDVLYLKKLIRPHGIKILPELYQQKTRIDLTKSNKVKSRKLLKISKNLYESVKLTIIRNTKNIHAQNECTSWIRYMILTQLSRVITLIIAQKQENRN